MGLGKGVSTGNFGLRGFSHGAFPTGYLEGRGTLGGGILWWMWMTRHGFSAGVQGGSGGVQVRDMPWSTADAGI